MSPDLGQRYAVVIGRDYPHPIVDNAASIRMAKARIAEHKRHPDFAAIAAGIYQKLGSRNRPPATRRQKSASASQQLSLF